jgi:hypothetical protein
LRLTAASLDYYYQLGFGARTVAARKFLKKAADFGVIVDNLLADAELTPAYDMLKQAKEVLTTRIDEVLKRMEIAGKTAFEDDLRADTEFWNELAGESGTGYRAVIARDSDQWFQATARIEKHKFVKTNIIEGWREVLHALKELIGQDGEQE